MDPLTIVFALVAVLAIWKLNSTLGRDLGFRGRRPTRDWRPPDPTPRGDQDSAPRGGDNVVRMPGVPAPAPASSNTVRWVDSLDPKADVSASAGLDAIAASDPRFSAADFLAGSRTAYEAIVTAFAVGERRTLQTLLARDVYEGFEGAVRDREQRHETLTTTFVSIDDAKVGFAGLEGRTARIGVRFLSKQISATHGADSQMVAGSVDRVVEVNDIWTFARDTSSRDPNWKLVATQSGA